MKEIEILTNEEYLSRLPEKCRTCAAEPVCYTSPDRCGLVEGTDETETTTAYFVMAFNVNDGKKKEFRHEIVKEDKDKAIALANGWLKEYLPYSDQIEVYVTETVTVHREILRLNNKIESK